MNFKLEWRYYKKVNKVNKVVYLLVRDIVIFIYLDICYFFFICFVFVL